MILTFQLLAGLAWLLHTALRMRKSIHMLQLNSYRNERYYSWFKQNRGKALAPVEWLPLLAVLPAVLGFELLAWLLLAVLYGLLILFRPKAEEKKKLVYTKRVIRLCVTVGLLSVLAAAGAYLIEVNGQPIAIILMPLASLLSFAVVYAGNAINSPIERSINNSYLNDARRLIQQMNQLLVIGITGSYGKTSVKHFLHTVLAQQYNVLMTPESFNTPMGITRTVREQLRPTHDIFIAEMGAKQTGDIKELCDLAQPKYGILTSIGPQHLDTFKSLENVQRTKYELPVSLPADGIAFLNGDDKNVMSYREQANLRCRSVTFGIHNPNADYRAADVKVSSKGTTFTLTTPNGAAAGFETVLLGEHNVMNILSAVAVGDQLGIPLEKLTKFVKRIKPVKHRLELKKAGTLTIIDDSFNSNPVGSKAALEVLKQMEGKRILITPGMIELGEQEYELNKALGTYAAEACDYVILVGPKQTAPIQDGLRESGYPEDQIHIVRSFKEAMAHLNQKAEPGSIVLLENDLPDNYNE